MCTRTAANCDTIERKCESRVYHCEFVISVNVCTFLESTFFSDWIDVLLVVGGNSYGAERFEDGASQINKSDMFFGDDEPLTNEQLKELDELTMKNIKFVKMTEGDVVLLDNYKTMHGRNVFDGTRKHGVCWFEGWEGEEEMRRAALTSEARVVA